MKKTVPTVQIDRYIAGLPDWRGKRIEQLRKVILDAVPDIAEDWKWNTPVWSAYGSVVAVGAFQDHVKVNFFKGALLKDPHQLFNAGLEAKTSRAIDIAEHDDVNEAALKDLIRAAVAFNKGEGKNKGRQQTKGSL
jgi:hypothetical protein